MLTLLMVFSPVDLTHIRAGKPDQLEVLVRKAEGLAHLFPYITDASGRTLWAHPDCVREAVRNAVRNPMRNAARHATPELARRTPAKRLQAPDADADGATNLLVDALARAAF